VILDGLSVLDTENITCRLVSDVWRRSRRSTRAGHDVAGPGLDLDHPDDGFRSATWL
jgi:hypothetical protein